MEEAREIDCRINIRPDAWQGMARLQSVRRGFFGFEEVLLVIVDGLAVDFAKVRAIPFGRWQIHDCELPVANC